MATAKLYAPNGEYKQNIDLPADLFDAPVSEACMYLTIKAYRTNQRQGTAKTQTRSETSGGTHKPWKQKGTGRARAGANNSAVWVRGNKAHGPKMVDYHEKVNKKVKQKAFRSALTLKAKDSQVLVFEKLVFEAPKTKDFLATMAKAGLEARNTLFLVSPADKNLALSLRNIPWARTMRVNDANTYEVVRAGNLVLSQEALGLLAGGNR
ncbi:MAG TPA: 50S ribosomal protein L4 [Fibrobacteraceae bacterium]|nr:50S ribosomal protein L4 [Fibrobacteraceae bacterium]